jgi:hydrogenase maturation protein HypF
MSQHIGDMENMETQDAFTAAVQHFQHIFRVEPQLLACDMHPGYLSTRWAKEIAGDRPLVAVQHHHAHIAAVMAEHRLPIDEQVIGFSFDGTGFGTDGAIWGGEVLLASYRDFERLFHLQMVPLAGGDSAVKRPYRMALAHLWAAGVEWDERLPCVRACPAIERRILLRQLESGLNTVPTSSMGRLFDAVASLAGIRQSVTYEGQAAIEMESLVASLSAAASSQAPYAFAIGDDYFDAAPVVRAVTADVLSGVPGAVIAGRFHQGLAGAIGRMANQSREQTGIDRVALSGGVFQNVTLLRLAVAELESAAFTVYTHRLVPPNDGGLALGQAVVAAARTGRTRRQDEHGGPAQGGHGDPPLQEME